MLTCADAEEVLLESFDGPLPAATRRALALHLATCGRCAAFSARMSAVDNQLSAAFPALSAPPSIAEGIRRRQRRERLSVLAENLPDIVHVAGCTAATLVSAALLPVETSITLGVGFVITCITYVVMAAVRSSLEAVEQPDW